MQTVVRMLKDKSGRVCQHFFKRDAQGPIPARQAEPFLARLPDDCPSRPGSPGYIACQKQANSLNPTQEGTKSYPVIHTDDVRVVTCPDCIATEEYKAAVAELQTYLDDQA